MVFCIVLFLSHNQKLYAIEKEHISLAAYATPSVERQRLGLSYMGLLYEHGAIVHDDYLDFRVGNIVERLLPSNDDYRSYVLKSKGFNASALAGGHLLFHADLLSYVQSEDEGAFVVSHELSHFLLNHQDRARDNASEDTLWVTGALLATVLAAASGAGSDAIGVGIAGLGGVAEKNFAYSRQLEEEADALGYKLFERAGYRKEAAYTLLSRMRKYYAEEGHRETNYATTHPVTIERMQHIASLTGSIATTKEVVDEGYAFFLAYLTHTLYRRPFGTTKGTVREFVHALSLLRSGKYQDALSRLKTIAPKLRDKEAKRLVLLVQAKVHERLSQRKEQAALLQKLADQDSSFWPATNALATLAIREKRFDEAYGLLEGQVASMPIGRLDLWIKVAFGAKRKADFFALRGAMAFRKGKLKEAKAHFARAKVLADDGIKPGLEYNLRLIHLLSRS